MLSVLTLLLSVTPPGERIADLEVDGRTAQRLFHSTSGQGRWAEWGEDRWLVFADGRVAGLRNVGGSGSLLSSAYFVVPEGQAPVTVAEQRALLKWANVKLERQGTAGARIAELPHLPQGPEFSRKEGLPAVARCTTRGVSLHGPATPWMPPSDFWVEAHFDAPAFEAGSGLMGHCPCYRATQTSALKPGLDVALADGRRLVGLHSGFRNDTWVLGVRAIDSVEWLAVHRGPLSVARHDSRRVWLRVADLDTSSETLVFLDTPTRALRPVCKQVTSTGERSNSNDALRSRAHKSRGVSSPRASSTPTSSR